MNTSKLMRYRLLTVVLAVTCATLIYSNVVMVNKIKLNRESVEVFSVLSESNMKRYGYSEAILAMLEDDEVILTNIFENYTEDGLIKIEAQYKGALGSLYTMLEELQSLENFESLDKITINKDNINEEDIYFTVTFKNNK